MRANSVGFAAGLLLTAGVVTQAQRSTGPAVGAKSAASDPANGRFELTVDSIMRGPNLVGWAPTGLRWAADSQNLFTEGTSWADEYKRILKLFEDNLRFRNGKATNS